MIASLTKSLDVHQIRTPVERLEKSPIEKVRSGRIDVLEAVNAN
jgi:hypothetical protein